MFALFCHSIWRCVCVSVCACLCACVCDKKCYEMHTMFFFCQAADIYSFDISELTINSPWPLHEFPWLSPMRSQAYGTHLWIGTISVLALSTRRGRRPRLEPPQRYSGLGSWWSALFYNALDISSGKTTRELLIWCTDGWQNKEVSNTNTWKETRVYLQYWYVRAALCWKRKQMSLTHFRFLST